MNIYLYEKRGIKIYDFCIRKNTQLKGRNRKWETFIPGDVRTKHFESSIATTQFPWLKISMVLKHLSNSIEKLSR